MTRSRVVLDPSRTEYCLKSDGNYADEDNGEVLCGTGNFGPPEFE